MRTTCSILDAWHTAFAQCFPPVHVLEQLPQWSSLAVTSTQAPLHEAWPAPQRAPSSLVPPSPPGVAFEPSGFVRQSLND